MLLDFTPRLYSTLEYCSTRPSGRCQPLSSCNKSSIICTWSVDFVPIFSPAPRFRLPYDFCVSPVCLSAPSLV
ncbi:hypothetical protein BCV70DRAFT_55883 [Testicularia cyperi]|uniref:Uncharacterized protein n=1 Tax=Testicularia cyperi TaxID=1882483 RepID=A0A317XUT0_9BASI|nr:hypothetical protein BCV70DRAFT_55883 [Testicularia cyperi]